MKSFYIDVNAENNSEYFDRVVKDIRENHLIHTSKTKKDSNDIESKISDQQMLAVKEENANRFSPFPFIIR